MGLFGNSTVKKKMKEQEKEKRKMEIERQKKEKMRRIRKTQFDMLEQMLQGDRFQNVIAVSQHKTNWGDVHILKLNKSDGNICYLKDYDGETDDYFDAVYCNLPFPAVVEALTLIAFDLDSRDGFSNKICYDEIKSLPDNVLLEYNRALDGIISGKFVEFYGILQADFIEKCKSEKKESDNIIEKRGLAQNFNPTKEEAGRKGEDEVEYALKWLPDEYKIIEKGNGIKLRCKLRGEDVQQEIDHIIVGRYGVLLIETKNYSGKIIIDDAGNWRRITQKKDQGEKNPIQQIERHHLVAETIIGSSVPIYDVICIANDSAIIEGSENSPVQIIKSDMLVHYIKGLEIDDSMTERRINEIIEKLNNARILV